MQLLKYVSLACLFFTDSRQNQLNQMPLNNNCHLHLLRETTRKAVQEGNIDTLRKILETNTQHEEMLINSISKRDMARLRANQDAPYVHEQYTKREHDKGDENCHEIVEFDYRDVTCFESLPPKGRYEEVQAFIMQKRTNLGLNTEYTVLEKVEDNYFSNCVL